jgi:5-methylcytosine-specific restriction protein A
MSEHRRPDIRFPDAPRGTCRWCGDPILREPGAKQGDRDYRRRWHPACVDAYNESDPREARRRARKRDRGVCGECGLDTNRLRRSVRGRGRAAKLRGLGFVPRRSLWELDHIVPLIDGGGHDLSNLQTLCVPCHRVKSAQETRERAERRRAALSEQSGIGQSSPA